MLDFEVNSNKKITLKETMHILDKYLYNNFDNFNHNYHINRLKNRFNSLILDKTLRSANANINCRTYD